MSVALQQRPTPGDAGFRGFLNATFEAGHITERERHERRLVHDLVWRARVAAGEEAVLAEVDELVSEGVFPVVGPDITETEEPVAAALRLTVMSTRELCACPDPPSAEELLGPLVRRGQRVVVGAHTGEGKTVKTRQMIRAIVEAEEYLEWRGVGGVRALVIDAEQEAWSIRGQLRQLGLDECEAVDYLCVPDGLALDQDAEQVAELERILADGGYGVVCADPLYKLHRTDSNDERAAVDLMRVFDAWRGRYGFALLMPVHCRKPQQPGTALTIHDLFGSSAYVRGAEVVLGLQLVRDGFSRLHFLKSRDAGLPVRERWGLLYDREDGFRRDPKDGQPSTDERLRELRATDPDITQVRAAKALGVSDKTIRRHWKTTGPETQESLLKEEA